MVYENSLTFARHLDATDSLKGFRDRFHLPRVNGQEAIYFCGNSLGLQPKTARLAVEKEMHHWQERAVEGHFTGDQPWLAYHKQFKEPVARLVGAQPDEVVVMNNLTTNLHLMLVSFYRPTRQRFKILVEAGAFPSDQYAVESQVKLHGYQPAEAVVEISPRAGECTLRTEDICQAIRDQRDSVALVLFGGINYYTGQLFDLPAIARAAHEAGAFVGFDLAHAAGNVPLRLHDWGADFAVWCTYKYLNSGPGGVAGAFVHAQHARNASLPRLAGWWGYDETTRFGMKKGFVPTPGADGWQLSNGSILLMAVHKAALDVFEEAGMENLRQKSRQLTGYLEYILDHQNGTADTAIRILTPRNPEERGCQLSLLVEREGRRLFDTLAANGIIGDWREPNVIRLSPAPLYNTFEEVYRVGKVLAETAGYPAAKRAVV
ncbi:MAG: kynureninase [Ferruginibacter sp.]|nr:kynureninase [Cytophagales bacterium]